MVAQRGGCKTTARCIKLVSIHYRSVAHELVTEVTYAQSFPPAIVVLAVQNNCLVKYTAIRMVLTVED